MSLQFTTAVKSPRGQWVNVIQPYVVTVVLFLSSNTFHALRGPLDHSYESFANYKHIEASLDISGPSIDFLLYD